MGDPLLSSGPLVFSARGGILTGRWTAAAPAAGQSPGVSARPRRGAGQSAVPPGSAGPGPPGGAGGPQGRRRARRRGWRSTPPRPARPDVRPGEAGSGPDSGRRSAARP